MRPLVGMVLVMFACGSRESPPAGGSAVVSGSATGAGSATIDDGLPLRPIPVTLPKVDVIHACGVTEASSFVTIDATGKIRFGPMTGDGSLSGGAEAPDLDGALDAIAFPRTGRDPGGAPIDGAVSGDGRGANLPRQGLTIRGRLSPSGPVDTIVFADARVEAGIVTDVIAGFSQRRVVGLAVDSARMIERYELELVALPPPPPRGKIASGPSFVVGTNGLTWWVQDAGGASTKIETAWSDAPAKLAEWAKAQHSLEHTLVAIDSNTSLAQLMTVLVILADANAIDIELGRRWAKP